MKQIARIAVVALLYVAFDCWGLTLGSLHGAALLGQPLDLAVQIQMSGGEDAATTCFEAELFHADTAQDASKLRVSVERLAQTNMAQVRVHSATAVDEPVVTLNLRYVCGQKLSRRYVLLADLPNLAATSSGSTSTSALVPISETVRTEQKPTAATAGAMPATGSPTPPTSAVPASKVKRPAASKPVAQRRAKAAHAGDGVDIASAKRTTPESKAKPVRLAGQPRLKLDPLELLSDRIANLDPSTTFAPTEDALLNIQKMKSLEGEVKVLRDSATKNERVLADFKVRLQQAEAERFPGVTIYVLIALVLACLLAVAWLWSRQRRASALDTAWWSEAGASPVPPATKPAQAQQVQASRMASAEAGNTSGLEAHSVHLTDSAFLDFTQTGGVAVRQPGPGPAQPATDAQGPGKLARSLNSDAVAQTRRRAQKLVSRGKAEQALALLRKQIGDSDEPNPLVYLDLLDLFHALDLKNDFQQFCQDFNLLFNGRVPEFALFSDEGKDLQAYPEALSRISAVWPSPKAIEVIEACIFRDPWAARSEPFDLAAMRELLLLHSIAQSLVLAGVSVDGELTVDSPESRPAQLGYADSVASSFPALSKSALADLFGRDDGSSSALDLDLSELGDALPAVSNSLEAELARAVLTLEDREVRAKPDVGDHFPEIESHSVAQDKRSGSPSG